MAKQEYEGVAFTAGLDKDGWLISVTERAESSAAAYANLEATKQLMIADGLVPFVSYYNKSEAVAGPPQDVITPSVDIASPVSLVDTAKELGGIVIQRPPLQPTEPSPEVLAAAFDDTIRGVSPYNDGTNFLGVLSKKPLVADCLRGDSFEIEVNKFEVGEDKVEFFNDSSDYSVVTQSLKGKGGKTFSDIFPGWDPQVGDLGPINPIVLYVVGEGETNQGNAWQNLKNAREA